jgi:hypothetical protein
MTTIAIIGTAGRDRTKPMTRKLWHWMVADALCRLPDGCHLVSGGAAWADHIAVALFLSGKATRLTLHLPAPMAPMARMNGPHCYLGPWGSAGAAANYYHQRFSFAVGFDSLQQINAALAMIGTDSTTEPEARGYDAMFVRNLKVAQADTLIAYTFGTGLAPADGGTANTWSKARGAKVHVSLPLSL